MGSRGGKGMLFSGQGKGGRCEQTCCEAQESGSKGELLNKRCPQFRRKMEEQRWRGFLINNGASILEDYDSVCVPGP
jgi:hypothetical protein